METLSQLADKYGTDKRPKDHNYTQMYEKLLQNTGIKSLLEIGLGSGASVHMWLDYFPETKIYCIENFEEENKEKWGGTKGDIEGLNLIIGDSTLKGTWDNIPYGLDVIVDDGDHHPDSQIKTFLLGFLHLKKGGLYFIEDTHCNFIESYTGGHDIIYKWAFDLIINQQCVGAYFSDFPGNFYLARPFMNEIAREIYSYQFYKSVIVFERA